MTRTATRLLLAITLGAGGAAVAHAQAQPGSATPSVGTSGDATKIASGNRENNAAYNQLIGATDPKASKTDGKAKAHHSAVAATVADIKPGSALRDNKGVRIGTIVSVDASQAVVDTGQTKIGVPLIAFGKDDDGLLLAMTAAKFAELVAKAHAH